MKKLVFLTILTLGFQNILQAQSGVQNELSKSNVYLDAGLIPGAHVFLNYEYKIHSGNKTTWYGRAGIGSAGIYSGDYGPGGLGAITMLKGKNNGHFELSAGAFMGKDNGSNDSFVLPLLDVGFRYQKPEGGFIFRGKVGIIGFGMGIGYAF